MADIRFQLIDVFEDTRHFYAEDKELAAAVKESLCRCSTLYPTLDRRWLWQEYYDVNRAAHDARHTDVCIYSPGIVIFKSDAFNNRPW